MSAEKPGSAAVSARGQRGPRNAAGIFDATFALLAEHGYDGLTVEGVAGLSGVNKTTLYRWWPSKDHLLAAALTDSTVFSFDVPDTGSLREDLTVVARHIARVLAEPPTSAVVAAALSALPRRPQLMELTQEYFVEVFRQKKQLFTRAAERGELTPGTDPETLMDLLAGTLWFRLLIRRAPLEDDFPRRLVDLVLDGSGHRAG